MVTRVETPNPSPGCAEPLPRVHASNHETSAFSEGNQ
jgi:hypothetical protein